MTFFLIVPGIMVVSTLLVYTVCNRLGLRLHYLTMIMCAILALGADFAALAFTDVPNKFFFIKLGGIISFAAAAATAINYFLVKRQLAEEAEFSEQVRVAYMQKDADEENISEVEVEEKISEPANVEETLKTKSEPEIKIPEKIVEPAAEVKPTEKTESEPQKKIDLQKAPENKVEKSANAETEQPTKIELKKPEEVEKIKPLPKPEISKPAEKVEDVQPPQVEVQGETLDDILDYAYAEKQQGHIWQATAAYKKALEKYKNDEYAPFVAIDLGNIYKEQAFYTKAIKTYEDALELPAVRRNASTKAEFQKNLIYLRTVQSVLLRHKALSTPFSKISRAYLQEIETEFKAMQMRN